MSNLTDLLPAGAGGKQVDFVACGTIGNGVTVALNSDGTVSVVVAANQAVGSESVFESASANYIVSTFDSANNRMVIAYQDSGNSGYGTAVVGTVSGTSISFGTPSIFASINIYDNTGIGYHAGEEKIVVAYRNSNGYGVARVGTVSGSSISFGSLVTFVTGSATLPVLTYDPAADKIVISYADGTNGNKGTSIVGTVSGSSISFGSSSVFETGSTSGGHTSSTYDSNTNKILVAFRDSGQSGYGKVAVGTVSGTSISYGSPVGFEFASVFTTSICYDQDQQKAIVVYEDGGNGNYGTLVVGTVSGTSISFSTPVVFSSASIDRPKVVYDTNAKKIVIAYRDQGNSNYGTIIVGTVSGNSVSFGSPVIFNTGTTSYPDSSFDSVTNKVLISYQDGGNSNYGTAVVFQNESTNASGFIGISDAAISDTASGSVTIKGGISTNVTGLTPNATYYVQSDGSLSTTASDVLAGKALSSTSINLDYTT